MRAGDELDGKYRLLRVLRDDVSGQTFEASHERLGRRCAVTILSQAVISEGAEGELRLREAATVAALGHPNILGADDWGRADGVAYLVTELVDGEPLVDRVRREPPLSPQERVEIIRATATALDAAAAAGVVHRDLRPEHVFLCRTAGGPDAVNVGGFGIELSAAARSTSAFAPPEPLVAGAGGMRSNVYSLSAIARWLLGTDVSSTVSAAFDRGLTADPSARFACAGELASALTMAPWADENVQFTVYRPKAVAPAIWHPMLAFAHLSERAPDAPADEPDPVERVKREAALLLGERARDYQDVAQDSSQAIPRAGEITFVPEMAGVEFNPPRRTFRWVEPVHREEFRLRAKASLDGKTARGRMTVYLGAIVIAEVSLAFRVDSRSTASEATPEPSRARAYRKIFASYSHRDLAIVEQLEAYGRTLGDEYLRDWMHLRAGEVWDERLRKMIEEADVFQLFWSANSMRSPFVRSEWEHALSLGRPQFIRPTYWEDPMPADPEVDLPPRSLSALHFQRLGWAIPPPSTPLVEAHAPSAGDANEDGDGVIDIRALSANTSNTKNHVDDIMNLSGGGAFGAALGAPILAPPPVEATPPDQRREAGAGKGMLLGLVVGLSAIVGAAAIAMTAGLHAGHNGNSLAPLALGSTASTAGGVAMGNDPFPASAKSLSLLDPKTGIKSFTHYAIILGVCSYGSPGAPLPPDRQTGALAHSCNNAWEFAHLLVKSYGYDPKNVVLMIDDPKRVDHPEWKGMPSLAKAPTKNDVLRLIEGWSREHDVDPQRSTLVFYYSGHGFVEGGGLPYLQLANWESDTRGEIPAQMAGLAMTEVVPIVKANTQASHVLYLLDNCHAGWAIGMGEGDPHHHTLDLERRWAEGITYVPLATT